MMIRSQTVTRTAYLMDTASNKWHLTYILPTHGILYPVNSGIFRVFLNQGGIFLGSSI